MNRRFYFAAEIESDRRYSPAATGESAETSAATIPDATRWKFIAQRDRPLAQVPGPVSAASLLGATDSLRELATAVNPYVAPMLFESYAFVSSFASSLKVYPSSE